MSEQSPYELGCPPSPPPEDLTQQIFTRLQYQDEQLAVVMLPIYQLIHDRLQYQDRELKKIKRVISTAVTKRLETQTEACGHVENALLSMVSSRIAEQGIRLDMLQGQLSQLFAQRTTQIQVTSAPIPVASGPVIPGSLPGPAPVSPVPVSATPPGQGPGLIPGNTAQAVYLNEQIQNAISQGNYALANYYIRVYNETVQPETPIQFVYPPAPPIESGGPPIIKLRPILPPSPPPDIFVLPGVQTAITTTAETPVQQQQPPGEETEIEQESPTVDQQQGMERVVDPWLEPAAYRLGGFNRRWRAAALAYYGGNWAAMQLAPTWKDAWTATYGKVQ